MTDPRVNYRIGAIDETKKAVDGVANNFRGLKKVLAGLGIGLSAAGVTRYVSDLITKTDQLGKLTSKIKVDVEEFQRLALVAARDNVAQDVLGKALEGQSRKIAEAVQGMGEAKAALDAINLDASSLFGLDPIAQFQAIAEALSQVEDQGTRLFAAQKLWEDQGTGLLNLITNQGYELQNLYAATADVVVKTEEQVKATEALATKWTELKQRIGGVVESIAIKLVPYLDKVVGWLEENADGIANLFTRIAEEIGAAINWLTNYYTRLFEIIDGVIEKIRALWALVTSLPSFVANLFGGGGEVSAFAPGTGFTGNGIVQLFNQPVFTGVPSGALE